MSERTGYFGIRKHLEIILNFMRQNIQARYFWIQWSLPFRIANLAVGVAIWFFFGSIFRGSNILDAYGGDFMSYLILGLAVNAVLSHSLNGYYNAVSSAYTGAIESGGSRITMMDYIMLARIPVTTYIIAQVADGYLESFADLIAYLVIGLCFFKVQIKFTSNLPIALLALVLGIIGTSGLGLISASMFWLINARASNEPIRWVLNLLTSILAGVYFPPSLLPSNIQLLSYCLPQTFTLILVRRALLTTSPWEDLAPYIGVLILFSVVLCYIGLRMFRYSLEVGKKKATIWS